jgi:hypothetical protein
MRKKIFVALALGGFVLGFQASALAAQDGARHHRTTHAPYSQQQAQPAPRYYDYYNYDQSQGQDAVGAAGSALGGLGH